MTRPTKTTAQPSLAAQSEHHDEAEKHSAAAEHDDGGKRELRTGHKAPPKLY